MELFGHFLSPAYILRRVRLSPAGWFFRNSLHSWIPVIFRWKKGAKLFIACDARFNSPSFAGSLQQSSRRGENQPSSGGYTQWESRWWGQTDVRGASAAAFRQRVHGLLPQTAPSESSPAERAGSFGDPTRPDRAVETQSLWSGSWSCQEFDRWWWEQSMARVSTGDYFANANMYMSIIWLVFVSMR